MYACMCNSRLLDSNEVEILLTIRSNSLLEKFLYDNNSPLLYRSCMYVCTSVCMSLGWQWMLGTYTATMSSMASSSRPRTWWASSRAPMKTPTSRSERTIFTKACHHYHHHHLSWPSVSHPTTPVFMNSDGQCSASDIQLFCRRSTYPERKYSACNRELEWIEGHPRCCR